MKRPLRFWIGVPISLCLAGLAVVLLVHEVRFGLEAVPTTATVGRYTGHKIIGRGGGTVVHEVDGREVQGKF